MTNDGTEPEAELVINPFNAVEEQNDYEVRPVWTVPPHGPAMLIEP